MELKKNHQLSIEESLELTKELLNHKVQALKEEIRRLDKESDEMTQKM